MVKWMKIFISRVIFESLKNFVCCIINIINSSISDVVIQNQCKMLFKQNGYIIIQQFKYYSVLNKNMINSYKIIFINVKTSYASMKLIKRMLLQSICTPMHMRINFSDFLRVYISCWYADHKLWVEFIYIFIHHEW